MKQKYTKAKKANRISMFKKSGTYGSPSPFRQNRRDHIQAKESPIEGMQLLRTQAIFLERRPFGVKVKTIYHGVSRAR